MHKFYTKNKEMRLARKSLGQNFLNDKNIIKKIVNLLDIKNRNIIEIGPGYGALTDEIIKYKPKSLSLIEKDSIIVKELKDKFSKKSNIKIYNADILKVDIEKLLKKGSIIFGNLPYNISSQILVKMIKINKWPPKYSNLIFMFQKELGEKIIGAYPSSNYGRLSILTKYRLKIIDKFLVSPNCFFPKPKVNSMVINFKPNLKNDFGIKNINYLEKVTKILFSNKRKMINKNIKKILNMGEISSIPNLKINLRPSEIKPEIYYKIASIIERK